MNMDAEANDDALRTGDKFVNNKERVESSQHTCRIASFKGLSKSNHNNCYSGSSNDDNNKGADTMLVVESSQSQLRKNAHTCSSIIINIESSELQKQVSHLTVTNVEGLATKITAAAASTRDTLSRLIASPSKLQQTRTSRSALDLTQILHPENRGSRRISVVGSSGKAIVGSLSDDLFELRFPEVTEEELKSLSKIEQQVRHWKSSKKISFRASENLSMDCLQRLQRRQCDTAAHANDTQQVSSKASGCPIAVATAGSTPDRQVTKQDQHLQSYARHLSHLYRKSQAVMDSNNDFRVLLYNIICCLMIQDEQVLSTPSVNKMIDVIRAHLESASRFYSASILSLNSQKGSSTARSVQQKPKAGARSDRNGSLGSISISSTSSTTACCHTMRQVNSANGGGSDERCDCAQQPDEGSSGDMLSEHHANRRRPADFRRISSVSFNDEQLIKDLCDPQNSLLNKESAVVVNDDSTGGQGASIRSQSESPWRYEELAAECKHLSSGSSNHHLTSESSLDNTSSTVDLMNDSGIGTLYDFHMTDEYLMKRSINSNRKRHSDVSEFRPKQRPAYISTDDCLSASWSDNSNSFYDGESSSAQVRCKLSEQRPVDVASRKAELEWTLNQLINLELKYTWLTSEETLRRAIRKIGVPNEIRGKVWLILIEQTIGSKYDAVKLLDEAAKTIKEEEIYFGDEETQAILKQIELDVNRTMPGHKLFDDGAEGGIKLRRILVAYSLHVNRAIAYCQGFNFIVALLLSIFDGDEQKALRGFICIVDHIFPSKFYFDHYLTGARADQFLLADFICDQLIKNPGAAERKVVEAVASSITLNWFISLFHGAVPTLTRLTILDHFMLDGVKALFKFTMAILYLAFQVTPPSSCDVFTTIRNTAKDMYDIKLLLSIVDQIKLPKDSYFAIRRSFYMVQSSFNSDQFYMQTMSNDASRHYVANKPLSVQHLPDMKPPAMSFISAASFVAHQSFGMINTSHTETTNGIDGAFGPRVCTSADRSKVCIQNIGKMGRSHIKIMDSNVKTNERSLMSPLRNSLVMGISNCGKNVIVARQSSRRNFKTFREQDLQFHVHELCTEIFDGFYLEDSNMAIVLTYTGEVHKIDATKCNIENLACSSETLMLRDCHSLGDSEKVKLRLASMDPLTNLLWIYIECEDTCVYNHRSTTRSNSKEDSFDSYGNGDMISGTKYKSNNPFIDDPEDSTSQNSEAQSSRSSYQRKILILDVSTFDIFSAFTLHNSFGDLTKLRTSLFAFCQLANPMSNQFSSRIVKIGPTGRYEHLLSFSDVVDFMIILPPEATKSSKEDTKQSLPVSVGTRDRYSAINRLIIRSISLDQKSTGEGVQVGSKNKDQNPATLIHYYRSLAKCRSSEPVDSLDLGKGSSFDTCSVNTRFSDEEITRLKQADSRSALNQFSNSRRKNPLHCSQKSIITSYLGGVEDAAENNYIPVIMTFIFRNGKIALFEFTESYAIHTRESQLDRYDYSRVVEVSKNEGDFIITILTIFDKLIKVVI